MRESLSSNLLLSLFQIFQDVLDVQSFLRAELQVYVLSRVKHKSAASTGIGSGFLQQLLGDL